MYSIAKHLVHEENCRAHDGSDDYIPFRPDHGHLIGAEANLDNVNPGYSFVGRLRGLSELRGLFFALANRKKPRKRGS